MLILIALLLASNPDAPNRSVEEIKAKIESLIAESGAELVGVAVYDSQTAQSLLINERVSFHAASTMKLPVMMEIFRQVEAKKLKLDDQIAVKNEFRSIVDGSDFSLKKADDSDDEVYRRIGRTMSLIDLIDHMITRSSNLATNLLIEKVGAETVNKLMRQLGAKDIQVRRGVEDAKAFEAGLNNTTTAYDLMLLLKSIAEGQFLGAEAREKMIGILSAQHFNDGIPAGLPKGVKVAHKTGEITKHKHDAGIVYLPDRKPYVIVVLTKGIADQKRSNRLIADISRTVYRALII
jgi:beta-lactamase class A